MSGFDPRPHLRKLNGKEYLEVVHRLQWLRSEHPDAVITTRLEHFDWEAGWAIFHARVELPGAGVAEGTGSETRTAFPAGWLEKAETVAVGRALAMLGFGTAFALADFQEGHPADAPVPTPVANGAVPLVTDAQLKAIWVKARAAGLDKERLEDYVAEVFNRRAIRQLTKTEASSLIDNLTVLAEEPVA